MTSPGAPVLCPHCAATIEAAAETCPSCRQPAHATPGVTAEEIAGMRSTIAGLAADDAPPDLKAQPGRWSVGTIVSLVLTVLGIIAAVRAPEDAVLALSVGLIAVAGIVLLVLASRDLAYLSPRGRRDGGAAVRCYFRSIQQGRWKGAFACLGPTARARRPYVPPITEIAAATGQHAFDTAAGVKSYWRSLVAPAQMGRMRRLITVEAEPPVPLSGDAARVKVTLTIEHYPGWIVLTVLFAVLLFVLLYIILRRTYIVQTHLVVHRYRGQWYLATGELSSPTERALIASFAEAQARP